VCECVCVFFWLVALCQGTLCYMTFRYRTHISSAQLIYTLSNRYMATRLQHHTNMTTKSSSNEKNQNLSLCVPHRALMLLRGPIMGRFHNESDTDVRSVRLRQHGNGENKHKYTQFNTEEKERKTKSCASSYMHGVMWYNVAAGGVWCL
jgi:hypothetical protein